ncbi:MAG: ABC transporter ATP-binding protein [Planctomycetota bacterium]|nr:ABC transporter ATP-binding protein [Planctomycetota bacterium]
MSSAALRWAPDRSSDGAPTSGDAAVRCDSLRRVYRVKSGGARGAAGELVALDGVSLSLPVGGWTALLGPNGSGKSTLMRILGTLDRPSSGRATVLGYEIHPGVPPARGLRALLGVVFQKPGLDPLLTVRENLRTQAALGGMTRGRADERAAALAERFGLAALLDERAGRLSGGMLRRADLARALVLGPRLLLLDEPTSGLDHEARLEFLELARSLVRTAGLTVLMSTHLMDEAERADRVVMLCDGRIAADGAPDDLRARLGGVVLSADAAHAGVLESAGLNVRRSGARALAAGDAPLIGSAARDLVGIGASFSVGPPTLGDVYMAVSGRALGEAGGAKAAEEGVS